MMELPKPPEDQDLKNIVDKLAVFVARNGPDFEQMTKQKQKDNPRFSFLFGGEYYNYYQYRVTTEQAIMNQQKQKLQQQQVLVQQVITQQAIQSAPWQQQPPPSMSQAPSSGSSLSLPTSQPPQSSQPGQSSDVQQLKDQLELKKMEGDEQVKQSEKNLAAQYASLIQQQQLQIDEAIRDSERLIMMRRAEETGLSVQEMDDIVKPIIDSCTKDAISNGKNWIFNHCTSPRHCEIISQYILCRVVEKEVAFQTRLHLIYLVNDVLHHCVRKNADELRQALAQVVVPIFCTTCAGVDEEKSAKLHKLLNLWAQNRYFEEDLIEKMRDTVASLAKYQSDLLASHADIVSRVSTEVNHRYSALQKQHQDYVNHINNQITQLESQVKQQVPPAPPALPPASQAPLTQPSPATSITPAGATLPLPDAAASSSPASSSSSSMPPGPRIPTSFPDINLSQPPPNFSQPPPGFGGQPPPPPPPPPPQQFDYGHGQTGPPPSGPVVQEYNHGQPPSAAPPLQLPDLSKPPPGFMPGPPPPAGAATAAAAAAAAPTPPTDLDLTPSVPYYDLPAGLMAPLVKLEDCDYEKQLESKDIRLPPPMPPSERLLAAVEAFYEGLNPERSRERSSSPPVIRDREGWEKLGLFEYFKAKNKARKMKEDQKKKRYRSRSRSRSRSPSRRYSRRRRSRSRSKSRSRSRSPPSHRRSRSRSRSASPPSFFQPYHSASTDSRLGEENKGHQLLTKMGWGGGGLGSSEQGIVDPVRAAEARDRTDMYKGIGISLNDPFEQFRKNKAQGFVKRMQARETESK